MAVPTPSSAGTSYPHHDKEAGPPIAYQASELISWYPYSSLEYMLNLKYVKLNNLLGFQIDVSQMYARIEGYICSMLLLPCSNPLKNWTMIYCSIAFWKTMVVADSVILHTTCLLYAREGINSSSQYFSL